MAGRSLARKEKLVSSPGRTINKQADEGGREHNNFPVFQGREDNRLPALEGPGNERRWLRRRHWHKGGARVED